MNPYKILGVDYSHWQAGVDPQKLIAGGVSFAIVKMGEVWIKQVSQGQPAKDDDMYDYNMGVLKGKIPCGSYYFYHPSAGNAKQLRHFKEAWERHPHDFPPILDCESNDAIEDKNKVAREIRVMLEGMAEISGRQPIVYTRSGWWSYYAGDPDFGKDYLFWLAQYNPTFTLTGTAKIKANVVMWQFTDRIKISGCPPMDGNYWLRSAKELKELTNIKSKPQDISDRRIKKNIFALSRANRRWLEEHW